MISVSHAKLIQPMRCFSFNLLIQTHRISGDGRGWVDEMSVPFFSQNGSSYIAISPLRDGAAGKVVVGGCIVYLRIIERILIANNISSLFRALYSSIIPLECGNICVKWKDKLVIVYSCCFITTINVKLAYYVII